MYKDECSFEWLIENIVRTRVGTCQYTVSENHWRFDERFELIDDKCCYTFPTIRTFHDLDDIVQYLFDKSLHGWRLMRWNYNTAWDSYSKWDIEIVEAK